MKSHKKKCLNIYKLESISTCKANLLTPSFGEGKWKGKSLSPCWLFADCTHGLYGPWNSLGQNTGVDSCLLLQGIFLTQGSNPVSHIAGWFFTRWATREAQEYWIGKSIPYPGHFPYPGIKLGSPTLQADSSPAELWNMLHLLESHTRCHMGSKGPDSPVDFRKGPPFFFKHKVRKRITGVGYQLVHNSLIGWWLYNKLVS